MYVFFNLCKMSSEYMHEANFKFLPQNLPETKMETYLQINALIALSVTIHSAQNIYLIQIKHYFGK